VGVEYRGRPPAPLLAYDDQPPGEKAGIFVMSLNGAPVTRFTTAPATMFDRFPAFSPDGKQIAFTRDKDDGGKADIYLLSLSRHEEKKLASLDRMVSSLTWTPDGKRIIFALGLSSMGQASLFSVTTDGREVERLQIVSSEAADPVVSRQGDRLAYVMPVFDTNIWKYSAEDNTPPSKLISSTKMDVQPNFSADGRRVTFVSNRDGEFVIWMSNADGSDAVRASSIKGGTPVWSPDGTQIAFDTIERGHTDIAMVAADGGKQEFLTSDSYSNQVPSWSADGNSVYFSSNRTGAWEIWKLSVRDKKMTQVTRHGGSYAQESPDGQFVYFQKPITNGPSYSDLTSEIWRMTSAGGREELVVRISDPDTPPHLWWFWRVTTQGIYFIDNAATPKPLLRFISLPTRKVRTLRQLEKQAWGGPGLAVSPDGKTILMGQVDEWGSDIMLAENFR
jgi:Tol biopolymer transport system component